MEFHAPVSLTPGKASPEAVEWETEWASEPVVRCGRSEKFVTLPGNLRVQDKLKGMQPKTTTWL
jgi:hypothetical protein